MANENPGRVITAKCIILGNERADGSVKIEVNDSGELVLLQKINGVFVAVSEKQHAISVGVFNTSLFNDVYQHNEVNSIDIVFAETKPRNLYVERLFFKVNENISSYSGNRISDIQHLPICSLDNVGSVFPKKFKEGIGIRVHFSSANQCDWMSGIIEVFAVFRIHPL